MTFQPRRTLFWGWGTAAGAATPQERALLQALARHRFGVATDPVPPPAVADFALPSPAIGAPDSLAHLVSVDPEDRLCHGSGKSFAELARLRRCGPGPVPDLVAYPATAADVGDILDWATGARVAVVPYGGGSSVVGGVTPAVGTGFAGVVSLDLQRLRRVLTVDGVSRTARIEAGVLGPDLERQLRPFGLTLRHYPQSFEFSSLGGWVATRAGGHFATGRTHIDDFVAAVTLQTPAGRYETRRLPATGAGPDPVRWVAGSEGAFGVITDATVRLQQRPRFKESAVVAFSSLAAASAGVRGVVQSGLQPANLRLLDRGEAVTALAGDGTAELVLVAFESPEHPVAQLLDQAVTLLRDCGGTVMPGRAGGDGTGGESAAAQWRSSFLRMPYFRDVLIGYGVIAETFETAVTWDRCAELDARVRAAVTAAMAEQGLHGGSITCRFTHVYPDGPAPYYTVMVAGDPGQLDLQWQDLKVAATEAIVTSGGTITHHHGVGRDHLPWYVGERPELQGRMLAAAKAAVDPGAIMNPGVIVPLP